MIEDSHILSKGKSKFDKLGINPAVKYNSPTTKKSNFILVKKGDMETNLELDSSIVSNLDLVQRSIYKERDKEQIWLNELIQGDCLYILYLL